MKVVVAGGSGLIGRALCAELAARGHDTVVLSRRATSRGGARTVQWNPDAAGGAWKEELRDAEAVVNLCGASVGGGPWTRRRKRVLRRSRLGPTRALVEAIASLPPGGRPRVLVSSSGTDQYEGRDARAADEDTPPVDTFLSRLCQDWEREAGRAEAHGVRVVLARTSLVIAEGAPALRLLALPFRLFLGGRLGAGTQWVSWIDVGDAVGILRFALESEEVRGPVNLAAPDARRQSEFAGAIAAALRRPSWLSTPAWLLRLVLGEQAGLLLGSRRVWPARALAAGYTFACSRLEDSLARRL